MLGISSNRTRSGWAHGELVTLSVLVLSGALSGCDDLGPCDEAAAREVVYTDDAQGLPAYAGQALLTQSCGGGSFCHASNATDRHGAPAGLDFDLLLASSAAETEHLRSLQMVVFRHRDAIWRSIERGTMPPGKIGETISELGAPHRGLPSLDSSEGREILRNWLACGVPVVERVTDDRPAGVLPVGAVEPVAPTIDTGNCAGVICDNVCVDTQSDPAHCGACDAACSSAEVCLFGACSTGGCPGAFLECSQACVDPTSSDVHCGSCDVACPGDRTCVDSTCECAAPLEACGAVCTNTQDDPSNCGECGNPCGVGSLCEGGRCVACGAGVSFARDVVPVFVDSCAGSTCHSGRRPAADMSLEPSQAYGNLVNVAADCGPIRVVPGAPESSYLIDKLRGRSLCRGQQMPLREPPLSDATIRTLENWICAGAPDN